MHLRTDNKNNVAVNGVVTHTFIGTNADNNVSSGNSAFINGRNTGTGETIAGLTLTTTNAGANDARLWKSGLNIEPHNSDDHIPITVHLGSSFAKLFEDLHDDVLNNTYEHRRQVENYRTKSVDLEQRLAKIEMRSNSLAQMYNTQFQAMESSVTGFNTTGNYLTSVVDQWSKS